MAKSLRDLHVRPASSVETVSIDMVIAAPAALETATPTPLPPEEEKGKELAKALGPGLITGASDDDPSGIGTYSVAGAQFGYHTLWLAWFSFLLAAAVQESCARIGLITGHGLATVTKKYYGKWVLVIVAVLLVIANTVNIGADIQAMGETTATLLNSAGVHIGFDATASLLTLIILILLVLTPYKLYVRYLQFFALALIAYIIVAFIAHVDWSAALSGFINLKDGLNWHRISQSSYVLTLVGILGTTISPYLFFWQANEEVEEEKAHGLIRQDDPNTNHQGLRHLPVKIIKNMRLDVISGMFYSNIIMFFIILASAAYFYTDDGMRDFSNLSLTQLAGVLKPLAGDTSYLLFSLGIIGIGMMAIPVLAGSASYAIAEMFDWKEGLNKKFTEAPGFYLVIITSVVIGFFLNNLNISPVTALYYAAILNGIIAVPLLFLIWRIGNNKKILGDFTNGRFTNILVFSSFVVMGVAAVCLLYFNYFS
jgi:NRAMP (natural resistance-associated macrophage protein)-like metal ion transporter